jgi:CBS domain containing-hemolysin-like protein
MAVSSSGAGNGHDRPDLARSRSGFIFSGDVPVGRIADFYGFPVSQMEREDPVAVFISNHLSGRPAVGEGVRLESVELVVQGINGDRITQVALDLDPPANVPRRAVRDVARACSTAHSFGFRHGLTK